MEINRLIEQTNLRPNLRDKDIDKIVREAVDHKFLGICIPPFWVKKAKRDLGKEEVKVITVAGFPLGFHMSATKIGEISLAIETGAEEVDMVMNITAFKSGTKWAKVEIAKASKLVHEEDVLLKVIIETAYLDVQEIESACKMCADAGVDFVKTSTGFGPSGASAEDVSVMRKVLPTSVGIKASGGIRSYEDAMAMVRAGADRIGTSSGVQILEGEQGSEA